MRARLCARCLDLVAARLWETVAVKEEDRPDCSPKPLVRDYGREPWRTFRRDLAGFADTYINRSDNRPTCRLYRDPGLFFLRFRPSALPLPSRIGSARDFGARIGPWRSFKEFR